MWAAMFPGQGSQQPGMGKFLYDEFKLARETFEEASDAVSIDFKKLCFDGSEADLALTENTQPCIVLVSIATYRVLKSLTDFHPIAAAGHSVGEYAAVCASGALKFADTMKAVRLRGGFMQSAVPVGQGGMMAVMGLNSSQVEKLCQYVASETGDSALEPANFNTPDQIVISGRSRLIDWLQSNFKPEIFLPDQPRTKFIKLKVSAPFHCSLMKPAEDRMSLVLSEIEFSNAQFSILPNVTATPVQNGSEIRRLLIEQITAPVRWVACVQGLQKLGARRMVEFGSGRVLAGLSKKIDSANIQTFNINSLEDLKTLESGLR